MYRQEERAEVWCEAGPKEGDEAEAPLSGGEDDGEEAAPGVEAVGVGDGRGGQAVAVPGSLATRLEPTQQGLWWLVYASEINQTCSI